MHKLMYFMQEAGEPLRLKYVKAPYGPYAENLRHVLNTIEGHLVSGYADGGDAPDKPLQLMPGAVEDATRFLQQQPETLARFDRVSALVDGFESPSALELLSSAHWIMVRESIDSRAELVGRLHEWSDRKRRFTPRQIGIASDVLANQGWTDTAV